jgi:hypothetical protein
LQIGIAKKSVSEVEWIAILNQIEAKNKKR